MGWPAGTTAPMRNACAAIACRAVESWMAVPPGLLACGSVARPVCE